MLASGATAVRPLQQGHMHRDLRENNSGGGRCVFYPLRNLELVGKIWGVGMGTGREGASL